MWLPADASVPNAPADVVKRVKFVTLDDIYTQKGRIVRTAALVYDIFVVQVKVPEEAKEPWDST